MCCIAMLYFSACGILCYIFSVCGILFYIFTHSRISCCIFMCVEFRVIYFLRVERDMVLWNFMLYVYVCVTCSGIVEISVIYICMWNALWYCGNLCYILCVTV